MKIKNSTSQPINFRYLSVQEIETPARVINAFFQATHLELFRQDLRLLFTLASTKHSYMKNKCYYHSELTTIHQQTIKFLEAAYLLLYDKSINFKIDKNHPLFQSGGEWDGCMNIYVDKRLQHPIMKHCRLLHDKEINNVKKTFKSVFKYMSLAEWREELDTLLHYALSKTPSANDCENSHILFPMYELLEKLLETIHVIHEFNKTNNEKDEDITHEHSSELQLKDNRQISTI